MCKISKGKIRFRCVIEMSLLGLRLVDIGRRDNVLISHSLEMTNLNLSRELCLFEWHRPENIYLFKYLWYHCAFQTWLKW